MYDRLQRIQNTIRIVDITTHNDGEIVRPHDIVHTLIYR